eukprot:6200527-Pleurochrysis_carterae.AAC.3
MQLQVAFKQSGNIHRQATQNLTSSRNSSHCLHPSVSKVRDPRQKCHGPDSRRRASSFSYVHVITCGPQDR